MHVEVDRNRRKIFGELIERKIEFGWIEFHTHEECAGIAVAMFIGVQDVAAMLRNESRDTGYHAFSVRTAQQQDSGFLVHRRALRSFSISRAALAPEAPVRPV